MKWLFLGISLKITSSLCKMKSKVTTGVKNTAHFTHSLYILLAVMEIFNTILFVSSLMITTTIQSLFIKQTILVDYLKGNLSIVDKIFYFSDGCAEQHKNCKNLINLYHQQIFNMDAECIFSATSHGKSPCDGVGWFAKRYVVKRSLQRPLHDQILSYQSVLDLCVREIPSITIFGVSQEEMVNVRAYLEDCFAKSKTVPATRSSQHLVPISCNRIVHKLTSEDREFLLFDFDKPLTEEIDIKTSRVFGMSAVSTIHFGRLA